MTSALDRAGYQLGSGMISPDGKRFLILIPKNASTLLSQWAGQNRWTIDNVRNYPKVEEIIAVLRDPIDRWISGIAQYINTYILQPYGYNGPIFPGEYVGEFDQPMSTDEFVQLYNLLAERLFFDVVDRFDDHVLAQSEFLQVCPNVPRKFFLLGNKNTVLDIAEYFRWSYFQQNTDDNAGSNDQKIKELQSFFKSRLTERPELVYRLQKHYYADMQLLKQL